jgi:hypothetical protein
LAVPKETAEFMGEGSPLFLVEAELTGETGFVGRLVLGLTQKGEKAFTKMHIYV